MFFYSRESPLAIKIKIFCFFFASFSTLKKGLSDENWNFTKIRNLNGLFGVYFRIKKGSMGIFCYSECCLLLMRQRTKNLSLSEFNNIILLAGHRSMDFPAPT